MRGLSSWPAEMVSELCWHIIAGDKLQLLSVIILVPLDSDRVACQVQTSQPVGGSHGTNYVLGWGLEHVDG